MRFVYKILEYLLSFICRIVNDIALIGLEIVQASKIDQELHRKSINEKLAISQ